MATQASGAVPFVSVCIPVRNGARELPLTLSNLLERSSYPAARFEVLLGNHESTDETSDLIEKTKRRFDNLRSIAVPYDGPNRSKVRNRLIDRCRGDVVIFIDHDVLTHRDFIQSHARAHRDFPGALIAGETFGKGFFRRPVDEFLTGIDLGNVTDALPVLRRTPEFADIRTLPPMLPNPSAGAELIDVSAEPASFRFFWTCNVSARRSDIDECGPFDESYSGWGIEDDDFAQQFRVKGKRLFYSRGAWGLHLPHPVDFYSNLISWRDNFDRFFAKWGTRELEYYSVFGHELGTAARTPEWIAAEISKASLLADASAAPLPERRGRRLAHFVVDSERARALDLTDALDPYVDLRSREVDRGGVRHWPFLGLRTAFRDREIDETVVHTDQLMLLDRHLMVLLMEEAARVSRHLLVRRGPRYHEPAHASARQTLNGVLERIHFDRRSWV